MSCMEGCPYSYFQCCGYFWSPRVSQKLPQGLVSHEMTAYLSVMFLTSFSFKKLWPYYQRDVNQVTLNHTTFYNLVLQIFDAFIPILLNVNLSLNQHSRINFSWTFLTFLLYVQTWMTQLIPAISLWGVIFFQSKKILLLICMVLQFMWKKDFLLHGTADSADSYLCFQLALLHSMSYFFFLYKSPLLLCIIFDSILSNIDKVLSILSIIRTG